MKTLFRGMQADPDGRPRCGSTARTLGVRVPEDIAPDDDGRVHPGTGGMSVAPDDPMRLRPHRRPRELGGTGPDPVFALPTAKLGASLAAHQDRPDHVMVEPRVVVDFAFYIRALHDTRPGLSRVT